MAPKDETPWRPCASDAAGPAIPEREPAAGRTEKNIKKVKEILEVHREGML